MKSLVFRWLTPNCFHLFLVLCPIFAENFMKFHSFFVVIWLADTDPYPPPPPKKSCIQMVIQNMSQYFQLFLLSCSTSPENIPQITPLFLESFAAYTEKLIKKNRSYVFHNIALNTQVRILVLPEDYNLSPFHLKSLSFLCLCTIEIKQQIYLYIARAMREPVPAFASSGLNSHSS